MRCYACETDAAYECRRCGRVYCRDHGDELCAECLKPTSALPSYFLYRGSLLALLVGTAVALWLLLKPPEEASESVPSIIAPTATAFIRPPVATAATGTPAAVTPAAQTPAPEATGTPAPSAATSTPGRIEHTVAEGDSLYSIAEQYLAPGDSLSDFAQRIAQANGLDVADPLLQPGQVLVIPR